MQESMRFCHVMHSMKRIEIFLSHIKDNNKFKNKNSLFHLVQCFKTIFVTFFIQYFKTTISFIWFDVSRFFFSLTHKKLFAFLFTHFTSTPLYTHAHNNLLCYLISNTQTKTSTFQRHVHNFNIVVPFDSNSCEQAMTKEGRLHFLFSDGSLRF